MQAQTIDFAAYRETGTIQPVIIAAAQDARAASLTAELKRVDLLIAAHEFRIQDLERMKREAATVELYDFLEDAISRERFMWSSAKMLRTVIERSL